MNVFARTRPASSNVFPALALAVSAGCSGGGVGAVRAPTATASAQVTATANPSAMPVATATPTGAPASGATLVVGPGRTYATLAAAVAAAHDGDTIDVVAGTYTNDFAGYIAENVTIRGVGGMAVERYTIAPPNLKAPFTVEKGLTLENFEISGVAIPASDGNNGAAIRLEGGNLTVAYCFIHDDQDGILADAVSGATVTVDHSEFAHDGAGDGYSHNVYVGAVASFVFTNDYSHDANVGHDLKSRALATTIANSVIADGSAGTASYEIDLPNAGNVSISGTFVEKGPLAQNPAAIHYGGEALPAPYPVNALSLDHDTFVNAYGASAVAVLDQESILGIDVAPALTGNSFWAFSAANVIQGGPAAVASGDTLEPSLAGAPAIPIAPPWASAPVVPIPSRSKTVR